jgi:hypothetical protein
VKYLEPDVRIYVEDLEAWEKKAGVKVSSGDALFIRTGRWARRAAVGPWDISPGKGKRAGLDASVIPWLKARDIALLGSDVPQSYEPGVLGQAVHDFSFGGARGPSVRQLRPRSARRRGRHEEPVGISADGGAAAGQGGDRLADQSDRDFLV